MKKICLLATGALLMAAVSALAATKLAIRAQATSLAPNATVQLYMCRDASCTTPSPQGAFACPVIATTAGVIVKSSCTVPFKPVSFYYVVGNVTCDGSQNATANQGSLLMTSATIVICRVDGRDAVSMKIGSGKF